MKSSTKTIPIIYNGGSYGTFIEWALEYFSGRNSIIPFNSNGNSHQFIGTSIGGMSEWMVYLDHPTPSKYARVHPKIYQEESVEENVYSILETAPKAILLYPDRNHIVTNINNKFEKIFTNGWATQNQDLVANNILGWGVQNVADLDIWEYREFLSLFIWKQHQAEVEIDVVEALNHPRLFKIPIADLFDRFDLTINSLFDFCEEKITRTDTKTVHDQWVSLQFHRNKDALIDQIVNATIRRQDLSWEKENLTLVDEAIIQMKLRDLHKLDMLCYNVNVFPSNTHDLRKILVNV